MFGLLVVLLLPKTLGKLRYPLQVHTMSVCRKPLNPPPSLLGPVLNSPYVPTTHTNMHPYERWTKEPPLLANRKRHLRQLLSSVVNMEEAILQRPAVDNDTNLCCTCIKTDRTPLILQLLCCLCKMEGFQRILVMVHARTCLWLQRLIRITKKVIRVQVTNLFL